MKRLTFGRRLLLLTLLFLGLLAVLTGGLCLTAVIPKAAIAPQIERSLDKLEETQLFEPLIADMDFSKQDNYADFILLNIIYCVDESRPLSSVLASRYVDVEYTDTDDDLRAALEGAAPETSYARYWHGSMLLLRPLLTFMDLQQIRTLNAVVLAALFIGILIMLIRRRLFVCAGAFALAAAVNALWLVPSCIEYTTTVMLAMLMCLLVPVVQKRGELALSALYLTAGVLTGFFDFLTTETLPALLPLVLLTVLRYYEGDRRSLRERALEVLRLLLAFAVGYGVMWASKWVLAAMAFGGGVFSEVLGAVTERTVGEVDMALGDVKMNRFYGAVIRNLYCLFPMLLSKTYTQVLLLSCFSAAVLGSVFYLTRRDIKQKRAVLLLLCLGVVPYIRYLALSNHSLIHYFFTYRAQTATVFALLMILVIAAKPEKPPEAKGRLTHGKKR